MAGPRFPGLPRSESKGFTPFDEECAARLKNAVVKHGKVTRPIRPSLWAKEFAALRRGGVAEGDIRSALDWLVANFTADYTPQAHSGKAFRLKYPSIVRCMAIAGRDVPSATPAGPDALLVVKALSNLTWPKGAGHLLPAAVQQSLDAAAPLNAGLVRLWDRIDKWERTRGPKFSSSHPLFRLKGLLPSVVNTFGGFEPKAFTRRWFEWVHRRVAGWGDWPGTFAGWTFSPAHKHFHALGYQAATEYGDQALWPLLLEALNVEEE